MNRSKVCLVLALFLIGILPSHAKTRIKLMYLETDLETRSAVLIERLKLGLPVYRIGIFRVGHDLYAGIRFGAMHPDGRLVTKHEAAALVAELSDRIFGEFPHLVRIDFEGVTYRETKEEKPEVLTSTSVERIQWRKAPKKAPALTRLQVAGESYYDPRMKLGSPPQPKPKPKAKSKRKLQPKIRTQTKPKTDRPHHKRTPVVDQKPSYPQARPTTTRDKRLNKESKRT